jgi:hypothetical protein
MLKGFIKLLKGKKCNEKDTIIINTTSGIGFFATKLQKKKTMIIAKIIVKRVKL